METQIIINIALLTLSLLLMLNNHFANKIQKMRGEQLMLLLGVIEQLVDSQKDMQKKILQSLEMQLTGAEVTASCLAKFKQEIEDIKKTKTRKTK